MGFDKGENEGVPLRDYVASLTMETIGVGETTIRRQKAITVTLVQPESLATCQKNLNAAT